jgi:hypothetical protein
MFFFHAEDALLVFLGAVVPDLRRTKARDEGGGHLTTKEELGIAWWQHIHPRSNASPPPR